MKSGGFSFFASRLFGAGMTALLLMAPPGLAQAQTAPPELAKIQSMVVDMGFTPKLGSSGDWFSITSSDNYVIDFTLSKDDTVLYLYTEYEISSAQQPRIPMLQLLQWNDTHRDYFSISSDKTLVVLNLSLPAEGLTPGMLRVAIDDLNGDAGKSQDIFDPDNWK